MLHGSNLPRRHQCSAEGRQVIPPTRPTIEVEHGEHCSCETKLLQYREGALEIVQVAVIEGEDDRRLLRSWRLSIPREHFRKAWCVVIAAGEILHLLTEDRCRDDELAPGRLIIPADPVVQEDRGPGAHSASQGRPRSRFPRSHRHTKAGSWL